jgi:hypothetical protein
LNLVTLEAANAYDEHWALQWESLGIISDALRLINGPRWRVVVYKPSRDDAIKAALDKQDKVDDKVRAYFGEKHVPEDLISEIKDMMLEQALKEILEIEPMKLRPVNDGILWRGTCVRLPDLEYSMQL